MKNVPAGKSLSGLRALIVLIRVLAWCTFISLVSLPVTLAVVAAAHGAVIPGLIVLGILVVFFIAFSLRNESTYDSVLECFFWDTRTRLAFGFTLACAVVLPTAVTRLTERDRRIALETDLNAARTSIDRLHNDVVAQNERATTTLAKFTELSHSDLSVAAFNEARAAVEQVNDELSALQARAERLWTHIRTLDRPTPSRSSAGNSEPIPLESVQEQLEKDRHELDTASKQMKRLVAASRRLTEAELQINLAATASQTSKTVRGSFSKLQDDIQACDATSASRSLLLRAKSACDRAEPELSKVVNAAIDARNSMRNILRHTELIRKQAPPELEDLWARLERDHDSLFLESNQIQDEARNASRDVAFANERLSDLLDGRSETLVRQALNASQREREQLESQARDLSAWYGGAYNQYKTRRARTRFFDKASIRDLGEAQQRLIDFKADIVSFSSENYYLYSDRKATVIADFTAQSDGLVERYRKAGLRSWELDQYVPNVLRVKKELVELKSQSAQLAAYYGKSARSVQRFVERLHELLVDAVASSDERVEQLLAEADVLRATLNAHMRDERSAANALRHQPVGAGWVTPVDETRLNQSVSAIESTRDKTLKWRSSAVQEREYRPTEAIAAAEAMAVVWSELVDNDWVYEHLNRVALKDGEIVSAKTTANRLKERPLLQLLASTSDEIETHLTNVNGSIRDAEDARNAAELARKKTLSVGALVLLLMGGFVFSLLRRVLARYRLRAAAALNKEAEVSRLLVHALDSAQTLSLRKDSVVLIDGLGLKHHDEIARLQTALDELVQRPARTEKLVAASLHRVLTQAERRRQRHL